MHLDNLLFLLLLLVAILLRALASAASKASKTSNKRDRTPGRQTTESPWRTSTPPPVPRAPVESDAERIRKFLEALGQPGGSQPPSPVVHRTDIPPRPVAPVAPPPGPFTFPQRPLTPGEWRKRTVILHDAPQQPAATAAQTVAPRPATAETAPYQITTEAPTELQPIYQSKKAPTLPQVFPEQVERKIDIAAMLTSPSGLRDIVVLREILGPPRSLQPLDLAGT